MYVIIGKYGVHMEEVGLVLTHPTGISFVLTQDEALGLTRFVQVYHDALATVLRNAEPDIQRIAMHERPKISKRARSKHK